MRKIVYVKYSNERDDKFKIKTIIEQDDSGKRYVKKYAMSEAAMAHILSIEKHEKLLSQNAMGTKLIFNRCTLDNGFIDCKHVTGKPLSAILNQKITQKDDEGALKLVQEYCTQLQHMATEPFVMTEEFEQVFGKIFFTEEQKSCKISDIDLIFSNILVNGNDWNVIDLEWTFDFPIPVSFLLYRAIMYGGSRIQEFAERCSVFSMLGIGTNEEAQFTQMEIHFQNWVKGTELPLADMTYFQKRTSISEMNAEIDSLNAAIIQQNTVINKLNAEIDALRHHANSIATELDRSRQDLESVLLSKSWKLTKPLRSFVSLIDSKKQ